MPIWDSVQRGLEKASQEAQRIAKIQRLRSTVDNLSRQMNTQHGNLINKTMDLYISGQLTQVELLPLCQELIYLKQQLDEAQNELKQVQVVPPSGPMPPVQPTPPPTEGSFELPPTVYAPPPPNYDTFVASEDLTPPPPPGVTPYTISAMSTIIMDSPPSPASPLEAQPEKRLCPACNAEVESHFAFCQNCGTLIQDLESQHLPTARAGMPELAFPSNEQTVQGEETISTPGETTPPPTTDSES